MKKINAYEILEIEELASSETIQAAFYEKAKIYHPDRGGKVEDFLKIKRASEILLDPSQRNFLGARKLFEQPLLRIQPSMNPSLNQLLKNLDVVKEQLKEAGNF
ncbi:MAG: DnaJ domain [Bacteriovoracaceae bacterium]|nr:DnaJ domain [Bacteriovoracaceae bacterium]